MEKMVSTLVGALLLRILRQARLFGLDAGFYT